MKCTYCKYKGTDFLKINEIEAEDVYGDTKTIVIFGCPKCKNVFFEYEHLL